MQKDFHYYCIGVLARYAGFLKEEAITIAYASAFVDDQDWSNKFEGIYFKPIVTAHKGLEMARYLNPDDQYEICIPFHFLPNKEKIRQKFGLIVEEFPKIAQDLFVEAITEKDPKLKLIRMGISLHTIADTWSHQGFSGIKHEENDIDNIQIKVGENWEEFTSNPEFLNIGHAMAACNPDNPALCWKYSYKLVDLDNKNVNNLERFLRASENIYSLLSKASGKEHKQWTEIKDKISQCLSLESTDVEKRCQNWIKEYPDLFIGNEYDHFKWWCNMRPRGLAKDDWIKISNKSQPGNDRLPTRDNFEQQEWFLFNKAAKMQRDFVLNNLALREFV